MLNEWEEFSAYTRFPEYKADRKDDTGYMGRFTFPMFFKFEGFGHVLTILARGYLFRDKGAVSVEGIIDDGSVHKCSP